LNEHGLFDYLLVNDDLESTAAELERIAEVCA
jgi:guanylate kinase